MKLKITNFTTDKLYSPFNELLFLNKVTGKVTRLYRDKINNLIIFKR